MRRLTATIAAAVLAAAGLPGLAQAHAPDQAPADHAPTQAGFSIENGRLVDANGVPFVARGTSLPHVWFTQEFDMFADAASLGANSVRVVLGSGHQWGPTPASEIRTIVDECKRLQMVCTLEVHDATGYEDPYGQNHTSITDVVTDYWTDPELGILDELAGEEAYVLVNIANEPRGNTNPELWGDETAAAIQAMRDHGYEHTLVVDAPNWGQDWTGTMRAQAPDVAAADPNGNTLFSVHMYEVYGSAQTVIDYFDAFEDLGLPLLVGEFGWQHGNPGQPVAWQTIMAEAQARGIGWYGWSWSGNSSGVAYLDQVSNFDPTQLTTWGQNLFAGPNGVQATAQCATVYDCEPPVDDTEPPTAPGEPTATDVTATTATVQWTPSSDNVGVTGYDVTLNGDPAGSTSTSSIALTGLTPETEYSVVVRARDAAGNLSDPSPPGLFVTIEGVEPPVGECAVTFSANEWGDGAGGFTASVSLSGIGEEPIEGWELEFTLPGTASVINGWSAQWSQSSQVVTAQNLEWNSRLGTTSIGFTGTGYSGDPTAFSINGELCQ